jgi:tetratricopeptide (TPR) repeat protein
MKQKLQFIVIALCFSVLIICGCYTMAASAEEYFSIGMAYYELGNFKEAETWLNRARIVDKTMVASTYNLGRIAYEMGRYQEAVKHFEDILTIDQNNVLALKAAAYTRIKTNDFNIADRHYSRLLQLVPESADDGYNHALVLYAMKTYAEAEKVLERYMFSLLENNEIQLLYARCQGAQNKVEAINSYTTWLNNNKDAKIRSEYAKVLEHHELYARAIEEYRLAVTETNDRLIKADIYFSLANVLLIADSDSTAGITELQNAVNEGFSDIDAVEKLLSNNISASNSDSIKNIISNMRRAAEGRPAQPAQPVEPEDDDEEEEEQLSY